MNFSRRSSDVHTLVKLLEIYQMFRNKLVQVVNEEDEMVAYFVIVIHLPGAATIQPHGITGYTQGWVISRKLADFRALYEQIIQVFDIIQQCNRLK